MRAYALEHLADADLLRALEGLVAHERATTATLLAHIAEVDARRLYLPAGHSSMYAYCVDALRLSEDSAYKRIRAARAARRFPVLFDAIADGRLSVSVVVLLVPHLTQENAAGLIGAAFRMRRAEVEEMLAGRFPRTEMFAMERVVRAVPAVPVGDIQADRESEADPALSPNIHGAQQAQGSVAQLAPGPVEGAEVSRREMASGLLNASNAAPAPRPRATPVSADRFEIQLTVDCGTRDKLNYARDLLSHCVPSGDLAAVVDRALDALIGQLEKRKFAAARKPRAPQGRSTRPRTIPAQVRREVWKRDLGRCTFVGVSGHRCGSRKLLEFDHVDPVARGGLATVAGLRLRCRAHNQYAAECVFGAGFMAEKRRASPGGSTRGAGSG